MTDNYIAEENTEYNERYGLAYGRIKLINSENAGSRPPLPVELSAYFHKTSAFLMETCEAYNIASSGILEKMDIAGLKQLNMSLYKDIIVDFSGFSAEKAGKLIDISPKEVQLLKILVDHTGVVLTRDQILDSIWGTDVPLNDRTIDTYIGRLRKKLGLDCIVTVKGIGYKFEDVR